MMKDNETELELSDTKVKICSAYDVCLCALVIAKFYGSDAGSDGTCHDDEAGFFQGKRNSKNNERQSTERFQGNETHEWLRGVDSGWQ